MENIMILIKCLLMDGKRLDTYTMEDAKADLAEFQASGRDVRALTPEMLFSEIKRVNLEASERNAAWFAASAAQNAEKAMECYGNKSLDAIKHARNAILDASIADAFTDLHPESSKIADACKRARDAVKALPEMMHNLWDYHGIYHR